MKYYRFLTILIVFLFTILGGSMAAIIDQAKEKIPLQYDYDNWGTKINESGELTGFTREDGASILQDSDSQISPTYYRIDISRKDEPFSYRIFYSGEGKITEKITSIFDFLIQEIQYDDRGQIISEENYDLPYNIKLEDVVRIIWENKYVDLMSFSLITLKIKKDVLDFPIYFILMPETRGEYPIGRTEVSVIDANTGAFIYDQTIPSKYGDNKYGDEDLYRDLKAHLEQTGYGKK